MLQDIIRDNLEFDAGAQTVVRGQENRAVRVALLKGDLVGNSRSIGRGVNARVRIGGSTGFASVGGYSQEDVRNVIRMATENAHFLDRHAARKAVSVPAVGSGYVPLNRNIVDFEQKRIIDACKEVDAYILQHYPQLASRRVVYSEDSQDKIIY